MKDSTNSIVSLTELEPLADTFWLGGPTFAAYLPLKDVQSLVDYFTQAGLALTLEMQPPEESNGKAERVLTGKGTFPILKQQREFSPSTKSVTWTTQAASKHTPSEAGEVLVILIAR
jgi:hypothetical protein